MRSCPGIASEVMWFWLMVLTKAKSIQGEEINCAKGEYESGFEWILHFEVSLNGKGNSLMIDLNL